MRIFRLIENNDMIDVFSETKKCISTIFYDLSEFGIFIYYCFCAFGMFIINCFKYMDNENNIIYKRFGVFVFLMIMQYVFTKYITPGNIIYANNQLLNTSKNLNNYIYTKILSNTITE